MLASRRVNVKEPDGLGVDHGPRTTARDARLDGDAR